MEREKARLREQIQEAWSNLPVYARALCESYLKQFPDDGFIWALYGDTLARLALFDDAETALNTANGLISSDFGKARVCGFRGHLAKTLGDHAAAERWYRIASELNPSTGDWHLFLGTVLRRQKRDAEAEQCFRNALALEGDRDEVLLNLGYVLQARGDLDAAAQCYREALTIDPEYNEAKESLEDVLKTLDFHKAMQKSSTE